MRILVVDDDRSFRFALVKWFLHRGFLVESAETASKAVELCGQSPFNLITIDSQLPGMNGAEAIPHIRDRQPGVPILMITGNRLEGRAYAQHPADDLLFKPICLKEIQRHVDALLHKAWTHQRDESLSSK